MSRVDLAARVQRKALATVATHLTEILCPETRNDLVCGLEDGLENAYDANNAHRIEVLETLIGLLQDSEENMPEEQDAAADRLAGFDR